MELPYDVTTQEYIEVIYALEKENRVARVTEIAERRGVTKACVSLQMQQLQQKELIERQQYGHITLTADGRRLGARLMKRHEIIRRFLSEVIGVSPRAADEDACTLEHIISQETLNAMQRFLDGIEKGPSAVKEIIKEIREGVVKPSAEKGSDNQLQSKNERGTDDPRSG